MKESLWVAAFVAAGLSACAKTSGETLGVAEASAYTVAGTGGPTVVFDSGLNYGRLLWSEVFLPVATDTTVFAYDRPGSHDGVRGAFVDPREEDGIRTGEEAVAYLRGLLMAAELPPPYILIGHSIGGTYALTYARLHPEELAGIVLVDGRTTGVQEALDSACLAAGLGEAFCITPPAPPAPPPGVEPPPVAPPPPGLEFLRPPNVWQMAESAGLAPTEERGIAPEALGDLPITLIVATEGAVPPQLRPLQLLAAPEEIRPLLASYYDQRPSPWMLAQQNFAARAANGRYVEAEGANHMVMNTHAALIVEEVRAMLDRVRGANAGVR